MINNHTVTVKKNDLQSFIESYSQLKTTVEKVTNSLANELRTNIPKAGKHKQSLLKALAASDSNINLQANSKNIATQTKKTIPEINTQNSEVFGVLKYPVTLEKSLDSIRHWITKLPDSITAQNTDKNTTNFNDKWQNLEKSLKTLNSLKESSDPINLNANAVNKYFLTDGWFQEKPHVSQKEADFEKAQNKNALHYFIAVNNALNSLKNMDKQVYVKGYKEHTQKFEKLTEQMQNTIFYNLGEDGIKFMKEMWESLKIKKLAPEKLQNLAELDLSTDNFKGTKEEFNKLLAKYELDSKLLGLNFETFTNDYEAKLIKYLTENPNDKEQELNELMKQGLRLAELSLNFFGDNPGDDLNKSVKEIKNFANLIEEKNKSHKESKNISLGATARPQYYKTLDEFPNNLNKVVAEYNYASLRKITFRC